MNYLYLILDVGTLSFPLLLSFDKNVKYIKSWKNVILASIIIGIPFIIWDVIFTEHGVWGFNKDYITGIHLFNLPIEEILFFIVVPFACTFIYECCKFYIKNKSTKTLDKVVILLALGYGTSLLLIDWDGLYTIFANLGLFISLLLWKISSHIKHLGLTYILSLIPFFIMNGILTGGFTDDPVVWYNELEKVPYRIFSIPMEDFIYSMSLIVSVIVTFEWLNKRQNG